MLPKIIYISPQSVSAERREARRRTVLLPAGQGMAHGVDRAILLDLSESGLRLQCHAPPRVGETVVVDLPIAGSVTARVVWQSGHQCGAAFEQPVTKAAVSAAILSSPPKKHPAEAHAEPALESAYPELEPMRAEWALLALLPLVLLLLFALAFLPVSGF